MVIARVQLENDSCMSTSRKQSNKILGMVSRAEADQVLQDLANLADCNPESLDRLQRRNTTVLQSVASPHKGGPPRLAEFTVRNLRGELRKAWDAPDRRQRDWYIFQLRTWFNMYSRVFEESKAVEAGGSKPNVVIVECPPVTPLEAVMFYFQTGVADKAKHCQNPGCPAPYFIAEKRWQKYCSEACSGPATRDAKRRWWQENRAGGKS